MLALLVGCESTQGVLETASERVSSGSIAGWMTERHEQRIESIELEIVERVNAFRAEHNVAPLVHRTELSDIARAHSLDMAEQRVLCPHRSRWRNSA